MVQKLRQPRAQIVRRRRGAGLPRKYNLPTPAGKDLSQLADQLVDALKKIKDPTADICADAKTNKDAQRLQTIPGIGPITASALVSALPDTSDFQSGRDLSA